MQSITWYLIETQRLISAYVETNLVKMLTSNVSDIALIACRGNNAGNKKFHWGLIIPKMFEI